MDDRTEIQQAKIINDLLTALRQLSIYPSRHPIVVESIKNAFVTVQLMITETNSAVEIATSPDGKISLNNHVLSGKASLAGEMASFMQKLEVEGLMFLPGLNLEEMSAFIRSIANVEAVKKSGDINVFLNDQKIEHVKARQFSYLKVEKGTENTVLTGRISAVKARLKDDPGTQKPLEDEVFHLAAEELREHSRLGTEVKALLRAFLKRYPDRALGLQKLRDALIEQGIRENDAGECAEKLAQDMQRASRRAETAGQAKEHEQELRQENERLTAELEALRQAVEHSEKLSRNLENENSRIFREKKRIDTIIHNLGEGMVVVDTQGRIVLVNPTAEAILGITKADVGKLLRDVVSEEHLLTFAGGGDGSEKDIEVVSPDETTRKVVRASSAVIEDNNGNTVGMVTMLNDITKQKELERLKSDFLANVSHELRTPLIAVDKSVSMLLEGQGGDISGTQQELLAIASRNLKRLTGLINGLLDLTKLEARRMELQVGAVEISGLVDECLETMRPLVESKSLAIRRSIPDLPAVAADYQKLLQVLTNLVGNAVKFTPGGGTITVSASCDAGRVTITVADTGPGIPEQDLEKVFDKFYQTKERPSSDICGTGIGLALVKEIVALHGGTVRAENAGGAAFIVTLPLVQPSVQ